MDKNSAIVRNIPSQIEQSQIEQENKDEVVEEHKTTEYIPGDVSEISDMNDLKGFLKKNIKHGNIVVMWFQSPLSDLNNAIAPRVLMLAKNYKDAVFLKMGFVFEDPPERTYRFHMDVLPSFLVLESFYDESVDIESEDINTYMGVLGRIEITDIDIDRLIILLKRKLRDYFSVVEEIHDQKELTLFWEYFDLRYEDRHVVYWFYTHSDGLSKEIEPEVAKLAKITNKIHVFKLGDYDYHITKRSFIFLKMDVNEFKELIIKYGLDNVPTSFYIHPAKIIPDGEAIVSLVPNLNRFDANELINLLYYKLRLAMQVQEEIVNIKKKSLGKPIKESRDSARLTKPKTTEPETSESTTKPTSKPTSMPTEKKEKEPCCGCCNIL